MTECNKILFIGDELATDSDLLRLLDHEGYELIKASGRVEGLEILRAEHPAIVAIDFEPGEGSGGELLRELRDADPACEVIVVTRGGDVEGAIEALRAGALDYLRRPVDAEQFRIALGRAREREKVRTTPEPPTILVLEDDEATRRRLVRILEKEGYSVEGAADGEEGMRLFEERRFDLIIADVRMPRKTGLEVLHETKGAGADVEVIVSTGYGDESLVVQALRDGAINFLRKPVDIEHLLLATQKALDTQTLRRSLAYRNRDVELMRELVVRLTHKLELVVETPYRVNPRILEFLGQLVDALPLGIVVAGPDRKVLYANRHVIDRLGGSPERVQAEWLTRMGIPKVEQSDLNDFLGRVIVADPGNVETMVTSQWSYIVMTPLRLVRPDGTEKFVALAIRGERGTTRP